MNPINPKTAKANQQLGNQFVDKRGLQISVNPINPINTQQLSQGAGIKGSQISANLISQFDVQLYPDMNFVENNGRGSISYGKCEKL